MFELSVVTTEGTSESLYMKDNIGRTKQVTLGESNYNFIKILPYWKEERIYDHTLKTKIPFVQLFDVYLSDSEFKQVFTLNNKLIIQKDENFNLFSLKTVSDALRLINVIEIEFLNSGRYDCLFVTDTNTVQRKELYDMLEKNGYKRGFLRKQFTY